MHDLPIKKVFILASGGGSNADAILSALKGDSRLSFTLGTNKPEGEAGIWDVAKKHGVSCVYLPSPGKDFSKLESYLQEAQPDLIVLAGYMRILPEKIIRDFFGKIINIHPALLPLHTGSMDGYADALAAGDVLSGCTVHIADIKADEGDQLAQAGFRIPDIARTDLSRLKATGLALEHALFWRVVLLQLFGEKIDPKIVAEQAFENMKKRGADLPDEIFIQDVSFKKDMCL